MNTLYKVKMTSKRTGKVGWFMPAACGVLAGCPTDREAEAGRFSEQEAKSLIDSYTATLVGVVGRCAWNFELVSVEAK